jgi:hypothetical protein
MLLHMCGYYLDDLWDRVRNEERGVMQLPRVAEVKGSQDGQKIEYFKCKI